MAAPISIIPIVPYSHRLFFLPKALTTGSAFFVLKNHFQFSNDANNAVTPARRKIVCIRWWKNILFADYLFFN
jgi:hypothetical protein